jgi:hypothetical protein
MIGGKRTTHSIINEYDLLPLQHHIRIKKAIERFTKANGTTTQRICTVRHPRRLTLGCKPFAKFGITQHNRRCDNSVRKNTAYTALFFPYPPTTTGSLEVPCKTSGPDRRITMIFWRRIKLKKWNSLSSSAELSGDGLPRISIEQELRHGSQTR